MGAGHPGQHLGRERQRQARPVLRRPGAPGDAHRVHFAKGGVLVPGLHHPGVVQQGVGVRLGIVLVDELPVLADQVAAS